MRIILEHIAKKIYRQKYIYLRGRILKEFKLMNHNDIRFDVLSKLLISGEDHRFYYHVGFDFIAIIRAVRNRAFYNKIEGASTIEQQLVRVLTNNFDRTFKRKIQEIFLATTIASIIPKNAIPKIYLNIAYYGAEMNGLEQAYTKLGIPDTETLPIEQAAEIVSRIKYPQTKTTNQKRLKQIKTRKKHLIRLYEKHLTQKYFRVYD